MFCGQIGEFTLLDYWSGNIRTLLMAEVRAGNKRVANHTERHQFLHRHLHFTYSRFHSNDRGLLGMSERPTRKLRYIICGKCILLSVITKKKHFPYHQFIGSQLFAFVILLAGSAVLLDNSTRNSSFQPRVRESMRQLIMNAQWEPARSTLSMIQEGVSFHLYILSTKTFYNVEL